MPIINRIADFAGEVTAWRRDIHQHPELQFDVHRTAGIVASKLREFGADETGARNSRDPEALASALQKLQLATQQPAAQQAAKAMAGMETANHLFIVNPLAGGPGRWFASHPPVEDRVARLREIGREIGQIF